MLKQFLGIGQRRNQRVVDSLYEQIVATARQQTPYSEWTIPDTPLGRYEMLGLFVFLVLHRLRSEGPQADAIGQELADAFFADVDHSLRELGIGDMGIPKRMKKLARMFYGRAGSYGDAIDADDRAALAAALGRNIMPEQPGWTGAEPMAEYVLEVAGALARQPLERILAGDVSFPLAPATTGVDP